MIDDWLSNMIVGRDRIIEELEVLSSGRAYDGRCVPEDATHWALAMVWFDGRIWMHLPLHT